MVLDFNGDCVDWAELTSLYEGQFAACSDICIDPIHKVIFDAHVLIIGELNEVMEFLADSAKKNIFAGCCEITTKYKSACFVSNKPIDKLLPRFIREYVY